MPIQEFLGVQWLGFSTFTAVGLHSIPGQGSNIPQPRSVAKKK